MAPVQLHGQIGKHIKHFCHFQVCIQVNNAISVIIFITGSNEECVKQQDELDGSDMEVSDEP